MKFSHRFEYHLSYPTCNSSRYSSPLRHLPLRRPSFSPTTTSMALPYGQLPQIFDTSIADRMKAGQDFEITWANATGSVTITLKNGPATDLKDVNVITGGVDGTAEKYTWSVPADLPADTYALEIDDLSGVPNYSIQFQLIGGVTTTSSSASSTSSSASSTSTDSTVTLTSSGTSTSTTTSGTSSSTGTSSSKTTSKLSYVPFKTGYCLT